MKLFFVMLITAATLVSPRTVEASELNIDNNVDADIVMDTSAKYEQNFSKTVYAKRNTEIFEYPDTESKVLGTSLKNTSFEVLLEADGWTMISTSDDPAFVLSADLSDEPVQEYTEEDVDLLARVISGESQACGWEENCYVASVVVNRIADPRFPNTLRGVVYQKGQYACLNTPNFRNPLPINYEAARHVLENGPVLPTSVVWQSKARQGKGLYIKTKYHAYCY